jgi:hypothetical protein
MTEISDKKPKPSVWNSLEICKLSATILTPLTVLAVGGLIWSTQQTAVQRWEQAKAEQRQMIESEGKERERVRDLRLSIYKEVAPLIDAILGYHFYVGRWKERSPADIIEKKRQLDTLMYSHIALFSPAFFDLYREFMRKSFRTAGNHFGESRIRSQAQCRQPRKGEDSGPWLSYFTHEDTRRELCFAYAKLLGQLSQELLLQSLKAPYQTEAEKLSLCPPLYDVEKC